VGRTALVFAAFSLLSGTCFPDDHMLVGTWKLVSLSQTRSDGTTWDWRPGKDAGKSLKIFSKTHFTVVTHGPDGKFAHANGGPYSIDGDVATEYVRYSSSSDSLGKDVEHHFAVEGDTLTTNFVNPADGSKIREVWKRVK
jgi:hypothetical protein